MKNKYITFVICGLIPISVIIGIMHINFIIPFFWNMPFEHYDGRPERVELMQLMDIAYDVRWDRFYEGKDDITVYIKENGQWEPFLVLTANYPGEGNGEVLLLRKFLLDERKAWREPDSGPRAYYPYSCIDRWLNMEYIQRFSYAIQEQILTTNIEVWDGYLRPNPRVDGHLHKIGTQIIERQFFLLSLEEMG